MINGFVEYSDSVENPLPSEEEVFQELDEQFRKIQEHVRNKEGAVRRGTHAKPTGLLKGTMVVDANLSAELAQGLFSQPGREYEIVVRLSQGPSEYVSDKASGQRGFSMKVLNVLAKHLANSNEQTTQDFVLGVHDKEFTDATAEEFLNSFKVVAARSTWLPGEIIVAGSRIARAAEAVLKTVSDGSSHLRFFGKRPAHPLSDRYFSQAPLRFGKYIAKLGVYPSSETLAIIGDPDVDTSEANVYQEVMRRFFADHEAVFELRAQLCSDLRTMPIEDATVQWSEEISPYRIIGRLVFPKQDPISPARLTYFEEQLSFNPIHAVEEHRALGSIMRARAHCYLRTQKFRQNSNGFTPKEPLTLREVPD